MKLFAFVAALAIAMGATSAFAGEVSKSSLSKMGLSSMTVASDNDGMQVRGEGVAVVFGVSRANILGNGSTNGYAAVSTNTPNALAAGASLSVGGVAVITPIGNAAIVGGGFGASVAYAR